MCSRWYWFSYLIAFLQIFCLTPPVKPPEFPRIHCLKGNKNLHGIQIYHWVRLGEGVEMCYQVCNCDGSREQRMRLLFYSELSVKARIKPFRGENWMYYRNASPPCYIIPGSASPYQSMQMGIVNNSVGCNGKAPPGVVQCGSSGRRWPTFVPIKIIWFWL